MPKIVKLDRMVADLIAAGEVVERPASVVKELVENALDAGAHSISVDISHGGLRSICVTDDGCGIEREDVPTAFLRHATSKVRTADDLAAISTMGFRGEALASIAAVSRVELRTKTADSLAGCLYRIEGGEEKENGDCGMPTGTSFTVRDLFYNTPARMKFIKNEAAEAGLVQTVVRSAALARPDVAFLFSKDGVRVFGTQGNGKLSGAVYTVYGGEFASGLINVAYEKDGVAVRGYTTRPAYTQGNRRRQEFYVNRRPISSRLLSAALEDAYRGRIMQGRFPACVLHIDLSPDSVDVNVHPAKTEVKFALESTVRDAVLAAVSASLDEGDSRVSIRQKSPTVPTVSGSAAMRPAAARPVAAKPAAPAKPAERSKPTAAQAMAALDFYAGLTAGEFKRKLAESEKSAGAAERITEKEKPAAKSAAPAKPAAKPAPKLPSVTSANLVFGRPPRSEETAPQTLRQQVIVPQGDPIKTGGAHTAEIPGLSAEAFDAARTGRAAAPAARPSPAPAPQPVPAPAGTPAEAPATADAEEAPWRIIGEAFDTYIIVEQGDDLLLVDKHAAHERIRYEELCAREPGSMSQLLLSPVVFTPEAAERELLLAETELLRDIGFELEDFGGGSIIVRSVPDEVTRDECEAVLDELAEGFAVSRRAARTEKREAALRLVSCKSALKAGSYTTPQEREALVKRIMKFDDIRYCPHGRPVAALLTRSEIERRMGRQQQ